MMVGGGVFDDVSDFDLLRVTPVPGVLSDGSTSHSLSAGTTSGGCYQSNSSSQDQASETSDSTRRSGSVGVLKRRKKDTESSRQDRWITNLENCNEVLSRSLDAMTKTQESTENRHRELQTINKMLEQKLSDADNKIKTLEKMLLAQKVENENISKELQRTTVAEDNHETAELKENLKAVTQLLLSQQENPDPQTMKLLKVLTAPIGGLGAIGSRTGVIGLESDKQRSEGVTPLALLGAAVAGPITEQPASSLLSMKKSDPLSTCRASGGKAIFDFGFRFSAPRQPGTTLFALLLCVGVSFSVSSDPMFHNLHPHNEISSSSRRLLQTEHSSSLSLSRVTLCSVLFLGVLAVTFVLTNIFVTVFSYLSTRVSVRRENMEASILPSVERKPQCQ
eukprot:TRINITY_DN875_c5_g1_i1.p1 TRINITY_DN875_c5_g1~~TRINITY_DN875_c5_g1_i1.p1  ORF type:complete len:393 (+),score=64.89 TRINITY_DN875_c5_g1_i1:42-1220(+)